MKNHHSKPFLVAAMFLFVLGMVAFRPQYAHASDPWYNSSWLYREKVTVNTSQVPSTQTSFPVYVNLANLPAGFFSHVRSDGGDIRVTNSSGTTELPREIVSINTGTGSGELWFKADSISDGSYFYIYYGNSGASDYAVSDPYGRNNVWDSNFQMVVHLNENAVNTTVNDSAGHVTNMTTNGNTTAYHDTGKINGGFNINTSGNGVKLNNTVTLGTTHTVSVWVNQSSLGAYQNIIANSSALGYWIYGGKLSYYSGGDHMETTVNTTGVWTYLTATMDGTNLNFYRNGNPDGSTPLATSISANGFGGDSGGSGERLYGTMDEEQVSNIARSANWIKTEFNNQSSPSSFYATTSEEVLTSAPTAPTNLSFTAPGNTQVTLLWNTPSFNGGASITDYIIEYKLSSEPTVWTTFLDGTSTVTTTTVTGLTTGSSYDFRVSAVNAVGQGVPSGTVTATPGATYYTVTYNGNYSTSGSVPLDSNIYKAGDTVTVLGNTGGLAKNSYNFSGWNTSADESGTDRSVSSTFIMGSGNVTLYAKWTVNVCIATGGTMTSIGGYNILTFISSSTLVVNSPSCNVQVLVVAGGGGSGGGVTSAYGPGGGGAGGLIYNPSYTITAQTYSVTVGDGGNGGLAGNNYGSNGQNSIFSTLTAIGGGSGAGNDNALAYAGHSGGSGGGGSRLTGLGGNGTSSQGYAGGKGNDLGPNYGGGAGGGSGGAGGDGTSGNNGGGAAGIGTSYSISGSPVTYATGGRGGSYAGGYNSNPGTANTGNGADAGSTGSAPIAGAKGGSGIVIIRYMGPSVPDAPIGLSAVSGDSQIGLSWTAPIFDGGSNIIDYVIEYKLSSEPTVWTAFNDGTSTATTSIVTGLGDGLSYNFRVKAVNTAGQGNYSNTATATPAVATVIATVTTSSPSPISDTRATLNGNITATGGANPTVRGFAYDTAPDLSTVIATTTETGSFGTGAFTYYIFGLTCGTTYYSRSYATNSSGTGFGSITSFNTSSCSFSPPTVKFLHGFIRFLNGGIKIL